MFDNLIIVLRHKPQRKEYTYSNIHWLLWCLFITQSSYRKINNTSYLCVICSSFFPEQWLHRTRLHCCQLWTRSQRERKSKTSGQIFQSHISCCFFTLLNLLLGLLFNSINYKNHFAYFSLSSWCNHFDWVWQCKIEDVLIKELSEQQNVQFH